MQGWWKWLIGAAVVVPLVAYVTGSLVAARSVPTQRETVVITVDPSSSRSSTPTSTPPTRPGRTPGPTPSSPSPSPSAEVERGPETVRPSPHDLDDDEPDDLDDERDDGSDDETEDDD